MAMTDQAQHGAGHQSVAGRRFTGALTSWERHPADLARFLVASLVCMAGVALTLAEPEGVQSTSSDLVLLFDQLPNLVTQVVVGILQVAALVAPVGAILYMRRGRWAELALAVAAAVVAGLAAAVLTGALADAVPPQIIADGRQPSWVTGSAFPSGSYLAAIAAAVTTIAPMLTLSWRRAARWTVVTVAIARVITAVEAPLNLIATVSLGVAIGSLALVAVGAPSRRPAASSIVSALADAGLVVDDLQPSAASTSHGPAYTAYVGDRRVFVKVVGRDERDADLLSRFVRIVRVKGVEDDRPLNPRLTVEREALNALMAAHAGASVPSVLAVGETDERGAFLALDHLDGVRLSDLSDDQLTTDVLASAFAQLAVLHGARIAHQWASTDQFLLRDDGSVSMLDFRWAELAANDDQLARDLAEMLASVSVKVGPQRTVAAAATHFSPTELAAALPLLQPLAVSSTTRNALRHDKQLIAALRTEVQTTAGVDEFEMLEMQRLTVRKVVGFVALLVIGNLLLGFVANFDDIWQEVKGADFSTLPLMFLMVALSYAGGAISLMGAVNVRLPFFRTTEIMFAQSFLNRFIPANAGGMALRARYLQRNGVDLVVAAASVGLTSAASGAMQVVMAVIFFTWAGRSVETGASSFSLPSSQWIIVIIVVLLAVIGIIAATAFGKKWIGKLRIQIKELMKELSTLARRPTKMLMLFGGPLLSKFLSVLILAQSMRAFGLEVHLGQLGAMYLTATTVAAAAPTPGGVGAIEAALAAGLTGLGTDPATAVAVVLFFRVINYWLPVLPCWIALHHVQRTDLA